MKLHRITACITIALFLMSSIVLARKKYDLEKLKTVKKVIILSVTMQRLGDDRERNVSFRNKVIDATYAQFSKSLGQVPNWEIISLDTYKDNPAYTEFVSSEKSRDVGNNVSQSTMPTIPLGMISLTKDSRANPQEDLLQKIGALCKALEVDAAACIYITAKASSIETQNLIVGDRYSGTVRMNFTYGLVGDNGKTILDLKFPKMDDFAPKKSGLPFRGQLGDDHVDMVDKKGKWLKWANKAITKKSASITKKTIKIVTQ